MNKNPFVPQPSYTPQQPPLPPGPPPPQPAQPDYSAYWAAAAAQQQQQQQQQQHQGPVQYTPQWGAPQPAPARPTPEQNALYANYGYGGQAGLHWQQQQQRQAQPGAQQPHYPPPPPPPVAQAPPPPPQPAYNPYQPTAGYPQPYIPQAPAQPMAVPPPYPHPQVPQPPQYYPQPHPPPPAPAPAPPQQPRNNSHLHHTPPQQLPPAKRQRFEQPSHGQNSRGGQQQQFQPPTQPQFQPPPPPAPQQGVTYPSGPAGQSHGRGGGPGIQRGGAGGGRGGSAGGGRGGRGGSMSGGRGGSTAGRGGRGGSMFLGGSGGGGGRGGGSSGQAAPLRGHNSRGGFGNTKDYHNRRGGSFSTGGGGGHQSMGNSSFRGGRGGGQSHSSGRGGRHDGGSGSSSVFGARDGPMASSFSSGGKKDENRRTLTDFKIIGLEMRDLGWTWGILPPPPSIKTDAIKEEASDGPDMSQVSVKQEASESSVSEKADDIVGPENAVSSSNGGELGAAPAELKPAATVPTDVFASQSKNASLIPPPPSRIRIYFHTPVSADDSHPLSLNSSSSFSLGPLAPSDSRKGKRKKLEDDDGDMEQGRGKRPPPQMGGSQMGDTANVDMDNNVTTGRGSVAPSVAETNTSEADWHMAAVVVQNEGDGGHNEDGDGDEDQLNVSQIEDTNDTEVGDDYNDGHDLIVDAVEQHSPRVDGQNGQEHPHKSSGKESNGSAEVGPNGTAPAVVDGPVPPLNGTNVSPDAIATKSAEGVAPAASAAAAAAAVSAAANELISSVLTANPAPSSEEQATNDTGYAETQAAYPTMGGNSLQPSVSLASTIVDLDSQTQDTGLFEEDGEATAINPDSSSLDKPTVCDSEAEVDSLEQEHLPEPPASPTSNTLLSTSSGSTYGGEPSSQNVSASSPPSPMKTDAKAMKTPSANRLSISYAAGSRRLVVDAGVVEKLRVFRADGRVEAIINVERDSEKGLKGILIEGLSEATKSYTPLPTLPSDDSSANPDPTLPTFAQAHIPSKIMLIAHLDTDRPLSEPKWVKSGDVQEWLKSMFGRMFWVAGDAADGWEKKIEVVDPDPAPTIWTILESWSVNSPVGTQTERQRFLKTHMSSEPDNILEILLRLVRGERATPFTGSSSSASITGSSVSGPLLAALSGSGGSSGSGSGGFAHAEKQTHVSLAVLAIWRMTLEYARKAAAAAPAGKDGESGDQAGVKEVEEKVGEIIRCLPGHLVYKSLDGMFKEWRVEKKGGR